MMAACAFPVPLFVEGREWLAPCGKCLACRIQKRSMWVMRMLHQTSEYPDAAFVTLTYASEHMPSSPSRPDGVLVFHDLQNFWKRLRKELKRIERGTKISYYSCGEYGEEGNRPHYHAIVWGITPHDEDMVQKVWGLGRSQCDFVEAESIRYVAGYVTKKLGLDNSVSRQGYPRPFQAASGGIGVEWLKRNWYETLYEGALSFRGLKMPLSRYYREKLAALYPDAYLGVQDRLCTEKLIADCDLILELAPHLGGRSWKMLSALEKTEVYHAIQRNGLLYNQNLAARQDIKLKGMAAKMAKRNERRMRI